MDDSSSSSSKSNDRKRRVIGSHVWLNFVNKKKHNRRPSKPFNWQEFIDELDEVLFCEVFRCTKETFYLLFNVLKNLLQQQRSERRRKRKFFLPLEAKLGMTLQCVAGSRVADIRTIYRPISKSQVFSATWDTVDATNKHFKCIMSCS